MAYGLKAYSCHPLTPRLNAWIEFYIVLPIIRNLGQKKSDLHDIKHVCITLMYIMS